MSNLVIMLPPVLCHSAEEMLQQLLLVSMETSSLERFVIEVEEICARNQCSLKAVNGLFGAKHHAVLHVIDEAVERVPS